MDAPRSREDGQPWSSGPGHPTRPSHSAARRRFDELIGKETGFLGERLNIGFESNPFRPLKNRFVIAASPRTGSTFLCEQLLAHGATVTESLYPVRIAKKAQGRGNYSLEDYCRKYIKRNTPNGVFGTKGWPSLLTALVLAGEFPAYIDEWKFVFLKRENVVAQAISRVVASRSGTWRSRRAPTTALSEADFDADEIAATVESIGADTLFWEDFFRLFGITPMRITYEALARDPSGVTASVAAFLGLVGEPIAPKEFIAPLQKQATILNETWERRFLELGWNRSGERLGH